MGFVLLLGLLAIVIMFVRVTADRIRTDNEIQGRGVETDAVVEDVRSDWYEELETDGRYYDYRYDVIYLRYKDRDGSSFEGKIVLDGTTKYGIGDRIRIRFLSGKEGTFTVVDPPLRGKRGQSVLRIKNTKVSR